LIFGAKRQDRRPEGKALEGSPWAASFWPCRSFARRAPMLLFVFDAELLTLTYHSPAFAALFQLPPAIGKYSHY